MVFPVNVQLDRLVLIYKNVSFNDYERFVHEIDINRIYYPNTIINNTIGTRAKEYKYNLKFGIGEGSIFVSYQHNSKPHDIKMCDMRIEFNPSKVDFQNYTYPLFDLKTGDVIGYKDATPNKDFFKILNTVFPAMGGEKDNLLKNWSGYIRCIREMDIAFDFNKYIQDILIISKTGKSHSFYKGTKYWGTKHTHGYLKMYDKKKERGKLLDKKFEKYEHLTRIEYTMRFEKDFGVNELVRIKDFEIRNDYDIRVYDKNIKLEATTKACLLAYINEMMNLNEFSRRYKEKIKTALEDMKKVDLDNIIQKQFKDNILNSINNFIRL